MEYPVAINTVLAETKKQIRAIELVVLVRVDGTLRFVGTRVRSRLRKLRTPFPKHGRAVARKGRSKRRGPSLVAAAA